MRARQVKRNWEKFFLSVLGSAVTTALAVKTWDIYAWLLIVQSVLLSWRTFISQPAKQGDSGDNSTNGNP